MNFKASQMIVTVLGLSIVVSTGCFVGCRNSGESMNESDSTVYSRATASEDGKTITFPAHSVGLQQIKTMVIHKGTVLIPVIAPARVVAIISPSMQDSSQKLILFESQEITSLYSQYRQSQTNLERARKNYSRTREMYDNHGATAKELNEAETDVATAQASFEESQGKLRAAGYAPEELERAPVRTAWLISDVPESQLNEVQQGEEVDIYFSAFPEKKYTGHALSIGDVVDPVTRSVKVRVTIPNPNRRFLPGMFARIDFGDPKSGIILLPASAVVRVEGKDFVFVATAPGKFERREVVLENTNSDQLIVKSQLSSGEEVVVAGAMLLKGLSFGY